MKALYPLIMKLSKKGAKDFRTNTTLQTPPQSFYELIVTNNAGKEFSMAALKGKNILLVNTASNCGYTNQYESLEKLQQQYKDNLQIIAFPSNDFKEQEKANDKEIAEFCKINYGITFPIMKKSIVLKSENQNNVYQWLSNASKNGWNNQVPTWNFCKYFINNEGVLTNFFAASVDPFDPLIINKLK